MLDEKQCRWLGLGIAVVVSMETGLQDTCARQVVMLYTMDLEEVSDTVRRCIVLWLCGQLWPLWMMLCAVGEASGRRRANQRTGIARTKRVIEVCVAMWVGVWCGPEQTVFWGAVYVMLPPAASAVRQARPPTDPPPMHVRSRKRRWPVAAPAVGIGWMVWPPNMSDPPCCVEEPHMGRGYAPINHANRGGRLAKQWYSPRGRAPRGVYVPTALVQCEAI